MAQSGYGQVEAVTTPEEIELREGGYWKRAQADLMRSEETKQKLAQEVGLSAQVGEVRTVAEGLGQVVLPKTEYEEMRKEHGLLQRSYKWATRGLSALKGKSVANVIMPSKKQRIIEKARKLKRKKDGIDRFGYATKTERKHIESAIRKGTALNIQGLVAQDPFLKRFRKGAVNQLMREGVLYSPRPDFLALTSTAGKLKPIKQPQLRPKKPLRRHVVRTTVGAKPTRRIQRDHGLRKVYSFPDAVWKVKKK